MPGRPRRRSIRLPGYDYAQDGAYFVTVCLHGRECLFGDVRDGQMVLNEAGRTVWAVWETLPARFPSIDLDMFVVMPNHVHGIIVLRTDANEDPARADVTSGGCLLRPPQILRSGLIQIPSSSRHDVRPPSAR
jgi:hypothetical protein